MKNNKFCIYSLSIIMAYLIIFTANVYAHESLVPADKDQMPSRQIDGAYWYNAIWQVDAKYADKTRVVADRVLPARSFFIPSSTESDALIPLYNWRNKENWQSLNGEWDFKLVKKPSEVIEDFHEINFVPDETWIKMKVPASWQLEENGIGDEPIYSNWHYPWTQAGYLKIEGKANVEGEELNYSSVATATAPKNYNPVGHYITEFTLKEDKKDDKIILNFQGVESAFYVYVNGKYVGYSEDTFTQHEFDISDFVNKDEVNKLAVLVYRWSDGSLLENQDLVNYSGIFRDTGIIYRSAKAAILDFSNDITIRDGFVELKTSYELSEGAKDVEIKLYDKDERLVGQSTSVREGDKLVTLLYITEPEFWSVDKPYLYKQVMAVQDENGDKTEYVGHNVGLREISLINVKGGKTTYALNGKPIVFKGVNRHELDNDYGRAVRLETIKKDLELMKQNNVNSIRMSHYTNSIDIYILADYYGLMVMDEANMETHAAGGLGGIPMAVETFRYPAIHRTMNMYERDKNFTCVVAWSNGNECIFFLPPAVNDKYSFRLMYKYIKERDQKRPVVLERDNRVGISDIRSRMYWPASGHKNPLAIFESLQGNDELILEAADTRPYLQVEYAHSMGNSLGYYKEYWDVWRRYEHAMGGFIWDWVDQSPLWKIPEGVEATGMSYDDKGKKVAKGGSKYLAYGGDWAMDKNANSDNFLDNGLISSDRIPHDSISQMKYVQQDILFSHYNKDSHSLIVENEFKFTALDEYDFKLKLLENGELVEEIDFDIEAEADSVREVQLPALNYELKSDKEYYIQVSAQLRADKEDVFTWAKAGYEIAFGEFLLASPDKFYEVTEAKTELENEVIQNNKSLIVKNENLYFELDKKTLQWTKYSKNGLDFFADDDVKFYSKSGELLNSGMYANFWRAPVDNDRQNKWLNRVKIWRESNIGRRRGNVVVNEDDKRKTIVSVKSTLHNYSRLEETYTIYADGHINYHQYIKPIFTSRETPAIGSIFELDKSFSNLSYYGRGERTTFVDRWEGYKHGIYEERVDFNALGNYAKPQENSNHIDVRWAKILNDDGQGLEIKSNTTALEIMASPYNQYDVTDCKHPYELKSTNTNYLRVNLKTQGVGGENSWGARPMPYAEIKARAYEFDFDIFPVGLD